MNLNNSNDRIVKTPKVKINKEKRLPTNTTLTASEKAYLKNIGGGNVSKGIRRLIEYHKMMKNESRKDGLE